MVTMVTERVNGDGYDSGGGAAGGTLYRRGVPPPPGGSGATGGWSVSGRSCAGTPCLQLLWQAWCRDGFRIIPNPFFIAHCTVVVSRGLAF